MICILWGRDVCVCVREEEEEGREERDHNILELEVTLGPIEYKLFMLPAMAQGSEKFSVLLNITQQMKTQLGAEHRIF